jgi:hypothetical protein
MQIISPMSAASACEMYKSNLLNFCERITCGCFAQILLLNCIYNLSGLMIKDQFSILGSPAGRHESIRAVNFIYQIPILKLNGELLNLRDSFSIIYFNDFIAYGFPYLKAMEDQERIISKEVKYHFFVYKKGETQGQYFDSINANLSREVNVDSVLKSKAFLGFNFYDMGNDSLVESIRQLGNNEMLEKHIPKIRYDQSYGDTTFYYYSDRFKKIDFSFSKILESVTDLKIFKIRIVYNEQFYKGYSFKFPPREFLFELKEFPILYTEELLSFFKKFQQEPVKTITPE